MTNYEAIKRMTMEQLEIFLDHVYLTGMNNALYLSRLSEDEAAEFDYETYDHPWLVSEAEEATEYVFDDDGDMVGTVRKDNNGRFVEYDFSGMPEGYFD